MKRLWITLLATAFAAPLSAPAAAQQAFDVLIVGGRVYDGSGNPWRAMDIGVVGDRIAAVGDLAAATADRVIDATGLYVAPGFIDSHSHAGGPLADPELSGAEPLLAQGVTTVVVNPDGGGAADLAAQRRRLEAARPGVNAAPLVPHGPIRRAVLGDADRAPTAAELDRMRARVRAGMEAGGFGFSTGLFYAPGSFAELDEVIALARVAAEYGGAYQSHIRDESDYGIGLLAAVEEVVRVAREAGLPGVVTHVKALGPPVWGFSAAIIERVERARSEGVEVYADQYPYTASSTGLVPALVPRWAEAGGRDSLLARLADPEALARIRAGMRENLARRGGAERIQLRRFEPDPSIEGRTLRDVAVTRGTGPIDAALALIRAGSPGIVSHNMLDADVERLMRRPWVMTASDGGIVAPGVGVPHPRNNGAFARKLRRYVLDREVLDMAAAIRGMTSLPAAVYGLEGRGWIRAGAVADIVVFDRERIRDRATYTAPHRRAEGVVHVLLSGAAAVSDGRITGVRAGRVLRRR